MNSVYFALVGDYVKIGFSCRPEHRVKTLLNTSRLTIPPDLDRSVTPKLLRVIPECIVKDERRIHDHFAEHRAEGEFFRATPELLAEIATLDYVTVREVRRQARRAKAERKWGDPYEVPPLRRAS